MADSSTPSFNVQASMTDNLTVFSGKTVSVHLTSGNSLSGVVGNVGDHHLHLKELVGKEFYDALVCVKHIEAIEVRAK